MTKKTKTILTDDSIAYRVLVFGDPHFALPAPASRDPATWTTEVESLCEQILAMARLGRVDRVACVADWFHSKGDTSHECVRWAMGLLRPIVETCGPILTIAGNHDMVGNNVNDSHIRQPISVLAAAGLVQRVDEEPFFAKKGQQSFAVLGLSYGRKQTWPGDPFPKYKDLPQFWLTHEDVTGPEQIMLGGPGGPRAIVNGHIHCPEEPRVLTGAADENTIKFLNIGVLNRVSIAEADWVPRVALVTLRSCAVTIKTAPLELVAPGRRAFVDGAEDPRSTDPETLGFLGEMGRKLLVGESDAFDPSVMLDRLIGVIESSPDSEVVVLAKRFLEEAKS